MYNKTFILKTGYSKYDTNLTLNKITLISPDEYIEMRKFKKYCSDLAKTYAKMMIDGLQFYMPVMDFTTKPIFEDGQHRVHACKLNNNLEKIPVLILRGEP